MAASLAALPGNEVLFASEYGRRDFSLPGVKRVLLKKPKDRKKAVASISTPALDAGERDWTMAYLRGRATASSLMGVLAEGFEPDMVILSGSMGNGLFVRNLFPEALLVGYADWYFRDEAETRYPLSTMPDIPLAPRNIRNTLQAKNFFDCNCHFTTTEWQREQYPEGMRGFISVLRKCVDTEFFAPAPASRFSFGDCELTERQEIVTLSVRDAARLREGGFWCELPSLLSARPDCHVVLISTGKEVRLDCLRESMAAFPSGMRGRIHLLDFLPPGAYRDLLCVSSLHLCKDISFMLPSELLEAMSCGCVVLAPDTGAVREVLSDGQNGFLYPSGRRMNWVMLITLLLERRSELLSIRRNARKTVFGKHNKNTLLPRHIAFLMDRYSHWRAQQIQLAEGNDVFESTSA